MPRLSAVGISGRKAGEDVKQRLAMLAIWIGCLIAALVGLSWLLVSSLIDPRGRRAWQIAEGFDQTANAALGGSEDMTLSAHAGFHVERPDPPLWARWLCRLLDIVDPGHCQKSAEAHRLDIKARHEELYGRIDRTETRGTYRV